jgi:glutamate synthase domain-containing protein 3
MTGGVAVSLESVGWNAGAGMTGGTAYLIDWRQLNPDSVVAREVPTEDEPELRALVEEHQRRTGSQRAAALLSNWADSLGKFRQIVPVVLAQPAAAPEPEAAQENVTRPVV